MPLAVKDVFNSMDKPTEHHSHRYKGSRPGVDAACLDTLRAAGALVIGKTVTTEFADSMRGGPTRNPSDLSQTPGGSSSGSAAAVADFQATVALGTQTGGSTIRPASYTGVFAIKPTWSSISRDGFKLSVSTCDTVGLFSRSADDLMLLAYIFELEPCHGTVADSLSGIRIGVCRTPVWPKATPEMKVALMAAADALAADGARISRLDLPASFIELVAAQYTIYRWETRASLLYEYRNTPDLADEFRARVENRDGLTPEQARAAYRLAERCRAELDDLFCDHDAILAPSAAGEAPLGHESIGNAAFNSLWTLLQVPVVNVPGFTGPNKMPLGLSLVTRRYEDRRANAFAKLAAVAFAKGRGC